MNLMPVTQQIGYARQRGYGAIVTTYGVGELSAMNAIAGSYAENVPVITIVGVPATKCLEEKTLVHHNFWNINTRAFENAHKSIVETTAFLNRDNAKSKLTVYSKIFVKEKDLYILQFLLTLQKWNSHTATPTMNG